MFSEIKYTAVLWDFDGTLANTGQDVWDSVEYAAKVLHGMVEPGFRAEDSNLGKTVDEIFEAVIPFPGEEYLQQFQEQIKIHYRTISSYPHTDLYPGIREILQWLKEKGIKCYIITMKPQEALLRILSIKSWEGYFDGWLSPDSLGTQERSKAELIKYLIKNQGLSQSKIVYIGDTYSDVIAARENSVDCIGVAYGDGDSRELAAYHPAFLADDTAELRRILEEKVNVAEF